MQEKSGVVFCLASAWVLRAPMHLLQADAFLALVCGREVAAHGIPWIDTLAVVTRGHEWTNEQWLGQLVIYGIERLGGLHLLLATEALLTGLTFAVSAAYALRRDCSWLSALAAAAAGLFFCSLFFGVRPQMFSLLLFSAVLSLVGDDKEPAAHRLVWTIPVLVLWANLHGAVILGAGLVFLRAALSATRAFSLRQIRATARAVLIAAAALLCPLASPYALRLPHYFAAVRHLQDPARHLPIVEWTPLSWPSGWLFFLLTGCLAVLLLMAWSRNLRRPNGFETVVLVLTALAAWRANRNVQWFGLALAAYGPAVFSPYLGRIKAPLRLQRIGGAVALLLLSIVAARLVLMPASVLESELPGDALRALHRELLANPEAEVVASDRLADWALWHEPLLAGRLAFDVRFELLTDPDARDLATFLYARPGWQALYPRAKIAFISRRSNDLLASQLAQQPGARVVWEDRSTRLIVR